MEFFGYHEESGQPNSLKEMRSVVTIQSTIEEQILQPPKQELTCREEYEALRICQARKQKRITSDRRILEFENLISEDPSNKSVYMEHAKWLEENNIWPHGVNIDFARHTWQRAIHVDLEDPNMWKEYAHFEMRNEFFTNARLVWLRATRCLPHVDELWKEHIRMEEMLGNFEDVGMIFERWIREQPSQQGWLSYIEFELKYNGVEGARGIFERFVEWSPENCYAWIKFAELERSLGEIERARSLFKRAFDQPALDMPDLLWKAYVDFTNSSLDGIGHADFHLLEKLRIGNEAEEGAGRG